MKIHIEQTIDAPIKDVWQVFGHEFSDIHVWSGFVQSSMAKSHGTPVGHATITGRTCETNIGSLDETIDRFDNDTHEISFLVKSDGFPFFMRSIHSHWQFFENGNQTRAKSDVTLDLMFPFNILIGWNLRRSFTKAINDVGGELKAHIETRNANVATAF